MEVKGKRLLVCNCEVTMALDGGALGDALGAGTPCEVHTQLCRAQIERFKEALAEGSPIVVGCTQEAALFEETRAESAADVEVGYTNVRERAGWADEGPAALPKIAALLAEATLDLPATPTVSMTSEGQCLVYGRDERAIDAARQLGGRLAPTVVLAAADEVVPPRVVEVPIFRGRVASARGHLGAFEVALDGFAPMAVSSRRTLEFERPRDRVATRFDLILDLTGDAPLLGARDGYLKPDPRNPAAVQRALFDLIDLVGEFEKPRYVDFAAELCAHSRSQRTGCTRCLDVCPASAIRPDGDTVAIDPFLCGGCGACHSVCPTGAAGYAYPPGDAVLERLRTLLTTYRDAGGSAPVLLVHDEDHGGELISLISRFGRGLPANVIPFALNEVTQLSLDPILTAFAYGAVGLDVLVPPKRRGDLTGLDVQLGHAEAVLAGLGYGGGRTALITETDPDKVETHLHDRSTGRVTSNMPAGTFLPLGDKRARMRLALQELHAAAPVPVDHVALAEGAPFGRVLVDTAGCTLCLACVSACPTGALVDNPERPQVSFVEDACVQCGLCRSTCPEGVIALEPRLALTDEARRPEVIKEEEPWNCVRCGRPFGTRATIEKIVAKLAEKHWMYQDAAAIERIKMCNDCRVSAQFEAPDAPLAAGPKPPVRTTEDYLREREEIEAARARYKAERDERDDE